MRSLLFKHVLLLLLCLGSLHIRSQSVQGFNWATRAATLLDPSSYSGQACNITSQTIDDAGNIYVAGDFSSSVEFYYNGQMTSGLNASSVRVSDIFVAKITQSGVVAWKKMYGNATIAETCRQVLVYNNSVFILGRFRGVPVGGPSTPVADGILRLDLNGNYQGFIPTVDIGNSSSNTTVSGFAIYNNVIYIHGNFISTVDFDVSPGTASISVATTAGFIQKLSMAGNHIDVKKFGGTGGTYITGLKIVQNHLMAVGRFNGTTNFNPNGSTLQYGGSAGFILKLDTSFNYQWNRIIDNLTHTYNECLIRQIAFDKTGDKFYIVGEIGGAYNFDAGNTNTMLGIAPSTTKRFVAKYNMSTGNMVWAKVYKPTLFIDPRSVVVDDHDDVYITGHFSGAPDFEFGSATAQLLSAGDRDAYISKLDSSSAHIWTKQMGGAGTDGGTMISLDPFNNIIATGTFNRPGDFNPDPVGVFNLSGPGQSQFAGTYTIKMGDSTTCAAVTAAISHTICQGQSYTFNGVNRTTSGTYREAFVNRAGCDSIVTLSLAVTPTVVPTISIAYSPSSVICAGTTVTLTATSVNGGSVPSYQWKKRGVDIATGNTYIASDLINSDYITCVLTTTVACATTPTVGTYNVTFVVNPTPTITVNSGSVCAGRTFYMAPGGANSYTYSSGSNAVTPTVTSTYSVTGTSAQGCITTNAAVSTVSVSPLPVVTVNSGTICPGQSFSITPSGASTYTITGNSYNVSPAITTNYNVRGTSSEGCVTANVVVSTVSVSTPPVISANSGSVCAGNSFVITPSGADTYTISGDSFNVSPTATTSYSITGTNAIGCVGSNTAVSTVSVNVSPLISVNSGTICAGNSFVINPSGASTYTVSGGSFNVSPSSATQYSVTGTSAQGCASSNTAVSTVVVNNGLSPVISISTSNASICGSSAVFTSTISNGGTSPVYQWKKNGLNVGSGSANYSPTDLVNGDEISCILVSNEACAGASSANSNSITITVNAIPVISVNSGSICEGSSFVVNPTGATTYSISGGSFNVSPTATTNYSITGTSAQGCVSSNTAVSTVSVNALPMISVNSGSICAGSSFVINPTGAATYTISGGSFNVSPTATTNYSITGTSAQGCVSSNTAVSMVSVNALPMISVNSGSICEGSAFVINPGGASTYTISGGSFNVSPTATSNYSVTGTSAQGCVSSNTAVSMVFVNALPMISVNSGSICEGNSYVINPTGANTYTISGGSFNVSPTATTNYSITGTSAQGCVSSNTAVSTVSVNALPMISVNSGSICEGSSFVINPTGATTYTISGGSFNVSPTATTNYSITGTSAQGCVSSNTAVSTVSVNALPMISVNSGSICEGSSFVINPGGATTYTISGGSFNVSPTATTNYSITGTSAQGCVSSNTAVSTVSVNALPMISVNSGSICEGSSFVINPTGATTYTISGGSFNVSPTATTNYSITGTSAQGCVSSNTAVSTVSVNALPMISVNSGSICEGSSFVINPTGATTYTISGGSFNVSPTATTHYSITGTSAQGCVSSNTAVSTVSVNALPMISVNSGSICEGSSFVINPTGATTYTISGGSFNVSPTTTTNYSITGTSAQGCVSSNTAVSTVSVNALPMISVNSGSICEGSSFVINPTGATTYTISGGSFNVSPTAMTNYSITGTSAQGCVSSNTAVSTVSVNALPTIFVNSGSICEGSSFVINPTGAATYTISGGSFNVSPTATTNYSITGTSIEGCVSSNTAVSTVSVNAVPVISVNNGSICAGESFTMTASGAATYTYSSGSQVVSPTANTNYSVTGTSIEGCVSSNTAISTVTVNAAPVIAVNSGSICEGSTFVISPTGATTYTISGGSFNVSPTATTNYSITGTSTDGCVSSNTAVSTVIVNATPLISVNSGSICAGNSFVINPAGATTYTISGGSFNVSPTTTTSYSITGTSTDGCVSPLAAVSTLTVHNLPSITASSNSGIICNGQSALLTAGGASTYSWSTGAASQSITVSPALTTTYTVSGTSVYGCIGSTSITQTVTSCTGIETLTADETEGVKVYPNPNSGVFFIELAQASQVMISDVLGRTLFNETLAEGVQQLDFQDRVKAVYFVTIQKGHSRKVIRVVVN